MGQGIQLLLFIISPSKSQFFTGFIIRFVNIGYIFPIAVEVFQFLSLPIFAQKLKTSDVIIPVRYEYSSHCKHFPQPLLNL